MNGKDAEERGRGLVPNTVPTFFWRKITKNLRIAGLRAGTFRIQRSATLLISTLANCKPVADFKFLTTVVS
jgi:hypothetical protein